MKSCEERLDVEDVDDEDDEAAVLAVVAVDVVAAIVMAGSVPLPGEARKIRRLFPSSINSALC
jgi:hypothetical protein